MSLLPGVAWAGLFEVSSVAGLGDALAAAAGNGEDDVIEVAAGTYAPTAPFLYTAREEHALTIRGAGAGETILEGGGSLPLLDIDTTGLVSDAGAALSIEGISFQGGFPAGGAGYSGLRVLTGAAPVTLSGCEFRGNATLYPGFGSPAAADLASATGAVTVSDCAFAGNKGQGVTVSNGAGMVRISGSSFVGNSASGATLMLETSAASVEGCTFEGNSERDYGGGLHLWSSASAASSLVIRGNTFRDNVAGVGGGLSATALSGDILVEDNTFTGNAHSYGYGGGADVTCSGAIVRRNSFSGNRGNSSAGMQVIASSATVEDNVFRDNLGPPTVVLATEVLFTRNLCSNNPKGCGVMTDGGAADISNNIVAGNTSRRSAAGLVVVAWQGTVSVANNTITRNRSREGTGGLAVLLKGKRARATVANNIVWDNAGPKGRDVVVLDVRPAVPRSARVRLVANDYRGLTVKGVNRVSRAGNIRAVPAFVDAAAGDFNLLPGSPCIDRGDNDVSAVPSVDFTGGPRIMDGDLDGIATVDIGALEYVR